MVYPCGVKAAVVRLNVEAYSGIDILVGVIVAVVFGVADSPALKLYPHN